MIDSQWLGKFVTAKLEGREDARQGWVIELDPFIIQGQSGATYECEGEPVLVVNPPESMAKVDVLGMPHICNGKPCKTGQNFEMTFHESWCGKPIPISSARFSVENALFAIEEKREVQPCPDCAREIIKQLLKAIE